MASQIQNLNNKGGTAPYRPGSLGTGQPGKFDPATGRFFPYQKPTIGDVLAGPHVKVVSRAASASVQSGGKKKSAALGMGNVGSGPR